MCMHGQFSTERFALQCFHFYTVIYFVETIIMLMLYLSRPCASTTRYCSNRYEVDILTCNFVLLPAQDASDRANQFFLQALRIAPDHIKSRQALKVPFSLPHSLHPLCLQLTRQSLCSTIVCIHTLLHTHTHTHTHTLPQILV